jgi:integrase
VAQVVPISDQLRLILKDARQRTDTYVVEYRHRPAKSIRGGRRSAVERAGLPFGRAVDGATFHTLRHTAASLLAELGEPESDSESGRHSAEPLHQAGGRLGWLHGASEGLP